MNAELKIKRLELSHRTTEKAIDATSQLVIAAVNNPAISLALTVALIELLARKGLINETERALLVSTDLVVAALKSFTPITFGLKAG